MPNGVDVILVTEGTYPHSSGGVSVWCDQLLRGLPEVAFDVAAITGNPTPTKWDLPPNVRDLHTVCLWDGLVPGRRRRNGGRLAGGRRSSGVADELAAHLVAPTEDPEAFADYLDRLADLPGPLVAERLSFDCLLPALDRALGAWADPPAEVAAADGVEVADLLDHLLRPLAMDPGPAPVYHSSSNGLAAVVAMNGARRHGSRFILTEHGIYLRERYLEMVRLRRTAVVKHLLLRFHRLVSAAAYRRADLITPGSGWNQRWEKAHGAPPERIRTIYNGIEPDEFPPRRAEPDQPTLSWLGRIDPIKDVGTLLRAFALVRAEIPEARLRLHGTAPDGGEWYVEEMQALARSLGVEGAATFEGRATSSAEVFHEATVAVLTSISEGFPYVLIEAMATGVPAVATGVGGVPEAVADTGHVVPPGDPEAFAAACIELLRDHEGRAAMGRRARQRVLEQFTVAQCNEGYRRAYRDEEAARRPLDVGQVVAMVTRT